MERYCSCCSGLGPERNPARRLHRHCGASVVAAAAVVQPNQFLIVRSSGAEIARHACSSARDDHIDAKGDLVFRPACAMGLEGIVAKRLTAPYWSGPSRDWLKIKNPDSPAIPESAGRTLVTNMKRPRRSGAISIYSRGNARNGRGNLTGSAHILVANSPHLYRIFDAPN
jgi:hypothetical protein